MGQEIDKDQGTGGQLGFDFSGDTDLKRKDPGSAPGDAPLDNIVTAGSGLNAAEEIWPADLTRRLRVLLHTLPLAGLRRSDSLRDEELRHYDGLALGLRVLDAVIDRLGLEAEADREIITRLLNPVLDKMDKAAGIDPMPNRHDLMIDKVLRGLRNDGDARRPFREEYASPDQDGQIRRFAFEFRLLFDAFHPSGNTVLRPSGEACNLYLRLLDVDIEDAQAAAEAVVESQLARGRFDEAVYSARQARIQSVRFNEKVLRILRDTRRDVDRVDWKKEAPLVLDESLSHLERRVSVERGILNMADERLEVMTDDEADGQRAVALVAELTRDCLLRHTELHEQLIGARNVFLDAQARQSFLTRPSRPLPDLWEDVIEPMLRLSLAEAGPLLDQVFPLFVGPRVPSLPSLPDLVLWMLQPRRAQPRREIPVEPVDATDLEAELRRYPPEVRAEAESVFRAAGKEARLSDLLSMARASGSADVVLEVIALFALQGFALEDRQTWPVATEDIPGARLDDRLLYGNDLLVQMRGIA